MNKKGQHKEVDYEYTRTEKAFMGLSLLLFFLMSYAYLSDFSIRRFFGQNDVDQFLKTPIARIEAMKGSVQRQRAMDHEFTGIAQEEPLYPNDSVMTSSESGVTIVTNEGEKFELGPNSLVKLVFDYDFASGGVVQKLKIKPIEILQPKIPRNIVVAKVVIRPTNEPVQKVLSMKIAVMTPPQNTEFAFTADEYGKRTKRIKLAFSSDRHIPGVSIHISAGSHDLGFVSPTMTGFVGEAYVNVALPGIYTWQVRGGEGDGRVLTESQFRVSRYVEIIKVLPVLGDSNTLEGFSTKKSFDGLTLQWSPVDGIGQYKVKIIVPHTQQVILDKDTASNRLTLNGNQVKTGKYQYYIERNVAGGFVGRSGEQSFGFEFLPPNLVAPSQNTRFDRPSLSKTINNIFFTWTKTNFTDAYQFEMSNDPQFGAVILSSKVKDNVKSIQAPPNGRYFWRVRSISGDTVSPPSQSLSFTVAR